MLRLISPLILLASANACIKAYQDCNATADCCGTCICETYGKCHPSTAGAGQCGSPTPAPPTPAPVPTSPPTPATPTPAPLPTPAPPPVRVYRQPYYDTKTTANVTYTKTLVHCTDQTDQTTCTETDMVLDIWQPTNSTAGPFPIVMTVHGGAFVSGDQRMADPSNSYFAERGFVSFAVQYRLGKDKGLFPGSLRHWSPKNTQPRAQWTPFIQVTYICDCRSSSSPQRVYIFE